MPKTKRAAKRAEPDELSVGDSVRWNASGGVARGVIDSIERDGTINVPVLVLKLLVQKMTLLH